MPLFKVTAHCRNGHRQEVVVEYSTREDAESFAGLLDGTHPLYVSRPADDPNSVIGSCGVCGEKFKASVEEVE